MADTSVNNEMGIVLLKPINLKMFNENVQNVTFHFRYPKKQTSTILSERISHLSFRSKSTMTQVTQEQIQEIFLVFLNCFLRILTCFLYLTISVVFAAISDDAV